MDSMTPHTIWEGAGGWVGEAVYLPSQPQRCLQREIVLIEEQDKGWQV